MRKCDLEEWQLEQRKYLVRQLSLAGWKEGDSNTLFNTNEETQLSAEMTYTNKTMNLMIGLDSLNQKIFLSFEDNSSGKIVNLLSTPLNKLSELLKSIILMQNEINSFNFRKKLSILIKSEALLYVINEAQDGEEYLVALEE